MADSALDAGLAALAALVRRREVSAAAVVDAALARITRLDPHLQAFCTVTADEARRSAMLIDRRIAAGEDVGPLAGVPVAIKDLICTRGLRTTFGSRLYADHRPGRGRRRRRAAARRRRVVSRQDQHLGVRLRRGRTQPPVPDHAQPLERLRSLRAARARDRRRRSPRAWCRWRSGSDGGGSVRIPARCAACSASSRRGAACRCTRAVATSAIRVPRAGSRSSTSDRSRATPPTRRSRCRCCAARRRATVTRCRPSLATGASRRPGRCEAAHRAQHGLGSRHGRPRGTRRGRGRGSSAARGELGVRRARRIRRSATRSRCSRRSSRWTPTGPACKAMAARQRRDVFTGWLARLVEREWTGGRVQRRADGTQAHRQRDLALHAALRFPGDADDRRGGIPARPRRAAADRREPRRSHGVDRVLVARQSHRPAGGLGARRLHRRRPAHRLQIMGRHLDDRGVLASRPRWSRCFRVPRLRPQVDGRARVQVP